MNEKNKYKVRLMRWGDSSSSGRTVTFKLPDDTDEHPFKGLPVGSKNGQLMEISVNSLDGEHILETIAAPRIAPPPLAPTPEVTQHLADKPVAEADEDERRRVVVSNVTRTRIRAGDDNAATNKPPTAKAGIKMAPDATPPPLSASEPLPTAALRPWPAPQLPEPAETAPAVDTHTASINAHTSQPSGIGGAELEAYADQMGQAAEALAAVAERMEKEEDAHRPHHRSQPSDEDNGESPGIRSVRRAVELCRAIDKQRTGFFYFMRALYPEAPTSAAEGENWSRDATATRDRVCLHCETTALGDLADNTDARKKFEELENNFERTERLR